MTVEELRVRADTTEDGVTVIEAAGYINNEGGQRLADLALERFRAGSSTLLFDLAGTRIINSIGVSILLEVLEEVLDRGGKMAFCSLSPTIAKTFEIMGLSQYARLYPDRAAALSELRGHER